MNTKTAHPNEAAALLELAREANFQIGHLAAHIRKSIVASHYDDELEPYLGMLSRIELLGEIVFAGAKLSGADHDKDYPFPKLSTLQAAFDGAVQL